jgi:hypothetical protein
MNAIGPGSSLDLTSFSRTSGGVMIQLSYISTSPQPMETEQLLALLQECLHGNRGLGVTGLLLYGNRTFLQVLEGDEAVVDALYEKIMRDTRHTDIKCLTRKTIERRQYAEWTMGFKRLSDADLDHVDGLKNFSLKEFNAEYLAANEAARASLMDHFSYWDPLVRAVEEKDAAIKSLKTALGHARESVEVARLVLESVADACRTHSVSDAHLRLCESTLETLS